MKTNRFKNSIAWAGTSRIISQYFDPTTELEQGNASWINWANGFLKQQSKMLVTLGNFAVSGTRTDQFASQVVSALATAPNFLGIDGPVNDIAQNYPSGPTVAATALANLKSYIKQANDQGVTAIYIWERGASSFTTTQMGYLADFNRMMADWLQYGDDWRGPPNVIVLDPIPYTVVTSSYGSISLKNSADGTHDNVLASQLLGQAFANLLAPYLVTMNGHRLTSLNQGYDGYSLRNIMTASGFQGTPAAPGGTGNTGLIPPNTFAGQNGGVTAAFSVNATSADFNGNTWGNEVDIACTATAAGEVLFYIALDHSKIVPGDIIRGGWEIDVAGGATALESAQTDLECFPSSGGPSPTYDLFATNVSSDPGGYFGFVSEPPAMICPAAMTGTPYTNLALRILFSGPGSATVKVRKPWAERATV